MKRKALKLNRRALIKAAGIGVGVAGASLAIKSAEAIRLHADDDYIDMLEVSVTPPNPAADTRRIFVDPADGKLKVRTDGGSSISLEEQFTNHDLLSSSHPDTYSSSPTKGDILYSNATPLWLGLAIGSSGQFLKVNVDLPAWASLVKSDITDTPWSWTDVSKTGSSLADLATRNHSDLQSVTTDQHHAQSHTLASHSTKAHSELTDVTSDQHHARSHNHENALDGNLKFAKGGTVLSPDGAINVIVWRAPYACTVTNVRGYRVGGTGATINARKNGASNHLSSALSLTSADTWMDGGSVQNTPYNAGDKIEIMIVSITGSPTQIGVQVDYTRP